MNGAGNGEPSLVVVAEEGSPNAGNGAGGAGLDAPNFGAEGGTLLVVATLITALTYQLGTNIPGGYWQDDFLGNHDLKPHAAGDPDHAGQTPAAVLAVHGGELGGVRHLDAAHRGAHHGGAREVTLRPVRVPGGLLQPRAHVRDVAAAHVALLGPHHLGCRHGAARHRHQVPAPRQAPQMGAFPVPCSSIRVLLLTFVSRES